MNELLESEEAPLPQAALQQWLQKLDVGWNKLLEMWESRREVLVQAHIFHLFLRDVKQAESFLNNQVKTELQFMISVSGQLFLFGDTPLGWHYQLVLQSTTLFQNKCWSSVFTTRNIVCIR